ncbi:MAG: DUF2490 domain-containing protein [Bacteroidetes bacterium]|nr:DUF2490 domain-containing protein [Bacteroidota bacterium]
MKIKNTLPLILLCFFYWTSSFAQKTITTDEQTWFGVLSQIRFSQRWGLWADAHLRLRENYLGELAQSIVRVGPTFYITDDVRLTAAYAYVNHFPGEGHENISQPEHRPWQQVQWFTRWPKVRLMQAIRLEERFRRKILDDNTLAEGYLYNPRVRYNFALFFPLTKKGLNPGGLQFLLNDEIMVNFGKNIVYNYFDQNRFFAGLAYQINPHAQLQGGYMNLFQQQASGNRYRNQHTIRIFYFHNFDLRKQATK